jgi:hypothetical protein
MPTLTSSEILLDVVKAFTKNFPALNRMGTDFRAASLKQNQTYTAHIPTLPTVDDVSTTYATTGNDARSLLVDVPIVVNKHKAVRLKWSHFDAIKDQKNRYDEVINLAGYALAKAVIDDLLSGVTQGNFSYSSTFAEADCDADMLINVTGDLNGQGALPTGRVLLCNTAAANALSGDSRITSKDFAGQIVGGNGLRRWGNTHGFAEILEYADFPTNNAAALNITGVASTDVITTGAAHGLVVGDTVTLPTLTGGSGLTASATTRYFVATVPSTTTLTLVTAAGVAVNFTTDISAGTLAKTENLAAFAFDMRAFALLAGVPDDFDQQFLSGLNVTRVMGFETVTDPESGLTMAAVSWQDAGTGQINWAPTIVWGKSLGRQGYATAAGGKCDPAGHRIITA